jgi:PadR family transcriptional regulator, regulatory protein PadR
MGTYRDVFLARGSPEKFNPLGRFEYSLLRAIQSLKSDAYGAKIGRYLSEALNRDVTAPQVYMTLERLSKRGLVRSENTEPVPERGGRSRRRFILEAEGVRALVSTAAAFDAISAFQEGVDGYQGQRLSGR